MGETKIQWADFTFNPWWGCTKVSPACDHCYAEALSKRVGGSPWGKGKHWGPGSLRTVASEKIWREPLRWNKAAMYDGVRRRVFCASMADVFEDRDDLLPVRARLYDLVDATPCLDWLLLTKRPQNAGRLWLLAARQAGTPGTLLDGSFWQPNVWLGTTIEDNRRKAERLPYLLAAPAAVRFVSYEPALEFVDFTDSGIDWLIIGGESGAGARPFDLKWAMRNLTGQVPAVFVKQLGARPVYAGATLPASMNLGGKNDDPESWPYDELRVQEFPR